MANNISTLYSHLLIFILLLILASHHVIQGTASSRTSLIVPSRRESHSQVSKGWESKNKKRRRMMIGSVAPTCTYNECRGCKYKCRAEQVPVEGNDPMNSPYHYKCVCHR